MSRNKFSVENFNIVNYMNFLQKKSKNGAKIKRLKPQERVIYLISEFEAEVNNGGFDQFFINETSNYASETIECLAAINAQYTANLLRKAIDIIAGAKTEDDLPLIEKQLDELDDKFYEYNDNLEKLQIEYIFSNKLV
ncbi:MAG: DUF4375 domain-containing protein [Vulcanibacillus sp.]